MNVAINVWDNRISPVFDSGRTLLIAEINDNALVSTSYLTFDFDRPLELLRMLRREKVSIIICGAISQGHSNMFLAAGFELISFIAGDVRRVLDAFIKGDTLVEDFKMPGCGKKICCRGIIRKGHEISTFNKNNCRGRCNQELSPSAVAERCDENNGCATFAEMSAKVTGKS